MIDNKILLVGGGAVLLLAILARGGKSNAQTPAVIALENQTANLAIAPAIVGTVSSFQLQHEQNQLNAQSSNLGIMADVVKSMDSNATTRFGQTLNFSSNVINANYGNQSDVRHVESATKIAQHQLNNEGLAIQGQIDIQKKQQDNNFITDLFGGAIKQGSGMVLNGLSNLTSIGGNLLGNMGGTGAPLSGVGGGVGNGAGAGITSAIDKFLPILGMVA